MIGLKNILDNLDITLLNIEHYTVGKEWNYKYVNNPFSRIYYITKGYGKIQHHGQEFELVPEQMYLIPCYTSVNLFCPQAFSHYYLHLTARLQTGLDILSIFKCHHQVSPPSQAISQHHFDRLLELNPNKQLMEYDANRPIYRQVLDRANHLDQEKSISALFETNALLRLLLAAFFHDFDHPQTYNTLHGLTRFDAVLDHIRDHLSSSLTIQSLAKIANLNPTYFSNLFSKLMGISPIQYINKRRVEEAQKLLISTDDTLYQIAHKVGFLDEYYFSRVFKKTVGISPDHYRKQSQLIHKR